MPNYCDNTLTLTHDDPMMIEKAKNAFENRGLLDTFVPVPKELRDTMAGFCGKETYAQELLDATEQLNLKWFGYKNWYDFCLGEWGTKWDIGGDDGDITGETPHSISMVFCSAWSPPVEAYKKLEELGFTVDAYYYESGCAFCGRYSDGNEETYGIDGNSEWVKDNIPEDIDDQFRISESMAEWEEENQEENEDA